MKIGNTNTTTETTEKKTYDPVPESKYTAIMSFVVPKDTKSGEGQYLDATFKIVDGDHANRYLFHKFHIKNKNPKCEEIGQDQLDRFLKCAGERNGWSGLDFDATKVMQYVKKEVIVNVGIEEGKNGYGPRNKITSFVRR